ncbi:MAG TPA: antibiotic biosynthesis monooxygenase family protein [Streptomyces sp.]|uniref:antibiotic biosynthesis monooxygenase family protein n=1 Tax=Streptomyces sp. TaxID=1931 RepID=UPI002CF242C4|nr:antibiotic biosynthesis monooxygenase family protein [Streptomyces sp.]HWU12306.1 antibiotic biosynthesis monooxygenase family protein [Streptomyces sp.]
MVIEHAELTITPGREAAFEEAFTRGHRVIAKAPGYRWARLVRQVEKPSTYLLLVGWETIEAHTVEFRESELFAQWRGAVAEYFAASPGVTHYENPWETDLPT